MRKITIISLLPLAMALTACLDGGTDPEGHTACPGCADSSAPGKPDAHYFALLEELGYPRAAVEVFPDGFVVEDDIFIPKADLDRPGALAKKAHRQIATVDAANADEIRIRIHPSISAWSRDVQQAVNFWNSVQSAVFLNVVASGGDIIVTADTASILPSSHMNLASNVCGRAGFPSGGDPFRYVSMNMDQGILVNDRRERIGNIAHEIGHTLGLAHTNSSDGTLISGTPASDNSIMNGSSCGVLDDNLSDWDRKALLILYPKDIPLFGTRIKDGDFRDDVAVWRPSNGTWYIRKSSAGFAEGVAYQWGDQGDHPVPKSDFDGDGLSDIATWRPSTGNWSMLLSTGNYASPSVHQWGQRGDLPMPGMDIDKDGKTDLVVYRWSDGMWHVRNSSTGFSTGTSIQWGDIGDIPVADTDMDRDGKDDLVVWRPSNGTWYWRSSSSGFASAFSLAWGQAGDIPVSGTDFDQDGRDEIVVWRPSTGNWAVALSSTGFSQARNYAFGARGDIPLADTDIDGDGKLDLMIWRRDDGNWIGRTAASGFVSGPTYQWGK